MGSGLGAAGVVRVVGIGPHTQCAELIGPTEQLDQPRVGDVGDVGVHLANEDFTDGAVMEHQVNTGAVIHHILIVTHLLAISVDRQGQVVDVAMTEGSAYLALACFGGRIYCKKMIDNGF